MALGLTAAWLIRVDRRESFRKRIGDLLQASEVCYSSGAYCFALARFGSHADAEILTVYPKPLPPPNRPPLRLRHQLVPP
ncbi:DUF6000 family protein [Streptomyces glebosus]|nr:DUF6000 family protein [Streptomyces glebosus]GHG88612.1 hypothetical protein GCM10010513_70910 [Streptomyces glebosus]